MSRSKGSESAGLPWSFSNSQPDVEERDTGRSALPQAHSRAVRTDTRNHHPTGFRRRSYIAGRAAPSVRRGGFVRLTAGVRRIFLLSPAHCGGKRSGLLLDDRASFPLARQLRRTGGAPLGDVFAFMSGLYFRGKLAYARAFARPPRALSGVFVITPRYGLPLPEERINVLQLREFAAIGIDAADARYREPLGRDDRPRRHEP